MSQAFVRLVRPGVLAVAAALACSRSAPVGPTPAPGPGAGPRAFQPAPSVRPLQTAVLVGAGDIGNCDNDSGRHAQETGRLLDKIDGTVFVAGDAAYMHGSAAEFTGCFDPAWGRQKWRTRPSPGNHEYVTPGATPYFDYFGANAGPGGLGFYSYNLGAWHVVSLNSSAAVASGSEQYLWLQGDLEANREARCTLAYFHFPRFTSGASRDGLAMVDIWRLLFNSGVDVVVSAHHHGYERFDPQDADGLPNPASGIREFVAGSGGAPLYPFMGVAPNSAQRISAYGVLKLTLRNEDYDWEFIEAGTEAPLDRGAAVCH